MYQLTNKLRFFWFFHVGFSMILMSNQTDGHFSVYLLKTEFVYVLWTCIEEFLLKSDEKQENIICSCKTNEYSFVSRERSGRSAFCCA
jgi:hypothetical protein